ncbi:MAG: LysR family transcriptional regulator [Alphaproteobacteria bacterium]|nr:MAG: LysR family transcriptional regulator [Alphaproteobacteria bacterium]
MTIRIEMLRAFVAVAQAGNLAQAAAQLGRTPSALSMTLKQLEAHLGRPLFESDRKSRLTPLGAHVLELAQAELRQFDFTVRAIETSARSPEGVLRVASIPSMASFVFPAVITRLAGRYPRLRVEACDADSRQVCDALVRGQADIGIVSGAPELNGVRRTGLFSDRFGLVCARGHPLACQAEAPGLEEAVAAGLLGNTLQGLISEGAVRSALETARVTVPNTLSLIAMVSSGEWVTILPASVAELMPASLVFRPLAGLSSRREVSMLMRERTLFPELAEAFWQEVCALPWQRRDGAGA